MASIFGNLAKKCTKSDAAKELMGQKNWTWAIYQRNYDKEEEEHKLGSNK